MMTKRDLIEALKNVPDDATLYYDHEGSASYQQLDEVQQHTIKKRDLGNYIMWRRGAWPKELGEQEMTITVLYFAKSDVPPG